MRGDRASKAAAPGSGDAGAARRSILDAIMTSAAPSTQREASGGRARNHACSNCRAAKVRRRAGGQQHRSKGRKAGPSCGAAGAPQLPRPAPLRRAWGWVARECVGSGFGGSSRARTFSRRPGNTDTGEMRHALSLSTVRAGGCITPGGVDVSSPWGEGLCWGQRVCVGVM